jgi:3-hydroxyacyl-[acyl-carrier-protein] dehydratase
MLLNQQQILRYLPHRDPFLFIDNVHQLEHLGETYKTLEERKIFVPKDLVGCKVLAEYRTRSEHPIFQGHFPGRPILPGVVQVEMMAQASSFVLLLCHKDPFALQMEVALLSVNQAKFRKPIIPEQTCLITAECLRVRAQFVSFSCQIHVDDQMVSESEVMAVVDWK